MSHYASAPFLHQLLGKALAAGATDVHLKVGKPPGARVGAELVFFRVEEIRAEDTEAALAVLQGASSPAVRKGDASFAYEAEPVGRFRVSSFRQRTGLSIVLRPIPGEPPTLAAIGAAPELDRLLGVTRGIVVVGGPPGSGRSTTAAAMIHAINEARACHIVTFEDPVEHLHADRTGSVAQRRVGTDVATLEAGLRGALRLDVDVAFASDLRSSAELDAALDLATRALVLVVVDAPDRGRAVLRIVDLARPIPAGVERLASSLRALVVQRLGGPQRVQALEIDARLRDLLRRGDASAVASAFAEGA